jgi:hypothetical protein
MPRDDMSLDDMSLDGTLPGAVSPGVNVAISVTTLPADCAGPEPHARRAGWQNKANRKNAAISKGGRKCLVQWSHGSRGGEVWQNKANAKKPRISNGACDLLRRLFGVLADRVVARELAQP